MQPSTNAEITILSTPYGYFTYNLEALYSLSQMGW